MKFLVIFGALLSVALANKHYQHPQHHVDGHHHKDPKCRGDPIIKDEEFAKARRECRREIKTDEEESEGNKHGRICRIFCSLTKIGVLNDKGFIVESKQKEIIEKGIVNQDAKLMIIQEVMECGRNATGLGIDKSDEACSNYKPYFECVWFAFVEGCADPTADKEE